jgi:chemotaxis signal transduction protein
VGQRRWALPLEVVREVVESPTLLPVPGARTEVRGVFLRAGVLVPVYDLAPTEAAAFVLVVEWADLRNGLRVADPDALTALGEEEAELPAPCSGRVRVRAGSAERVSLPALYRMLAIPA